MATEIIEKKLYGGKVTIHFYPNSHQYKLVKDGEKTNIPSVTSFTGLIDKSRVLMGWAVKMYTKKIKELMASGDVFNRMDLESMLVAGENAHVEEKTKAADIGTYVHNFLEEYSKALNAKLAYDKVMAELGMPSEEMKKKIDAGVQGAVAWLNSEKIKILEAEQIVYSKNFDYVGKFDAIVEYNGKKYLADYKTSNGVYNEYYYQTSAYLKAWEEEKGEKLDGALIIAIVKEDKEDKDGIVVKKAGDIIPEFRSRGDLLKDYIAFKGLLPVGAREKELKAEWFKSNKK